MNCHGGNSPFASCTVVGLRIVSDLKQKTESRAVVGLRIRIRGGREGRGCTSILRNLNCRDHAGLQAHEHGHPSIPGAWLPLVPPGSTWLLKTISWVSLGLPVAPLGSSWLPLAPPGSSWQILASSPGTSWLLLAPPGSFSLLVAARGYFWFLLGGRSKTYDGDCWKNRL